MNNGVSNGDKGVINLEEELAKINERYEKGEMKAFGVNQDSVLKKFQEIRKMQAQLSMKQVAMGMNNSAIDPKEFMETTNINEMFKDKEQDDTGVLTDTLNSICDAVERLSDSLK